MSAVCPGAGSHYLTFSVMNLIKIIHAFQLCSLHVPCIAYSSILFSMHQMIAFHDALSTKTIKCCELEADPKKFGKCDLTANHVLTLCRLTVNEYGANQMLIKVAAKLSANPKRYETKMMLSLLSGESGDRYHQILLSSLDGKQDSNLWKSLVLSMVIFQKEIASKRRSLLRQHLYKDMISDSGERSERDSIFEYLSRKPLNDHAVTMCWIKELEFVIDDAVNRVPVSDAVIQQIQRKANCVYVDLRDYEHELLESIYMKGDHYDFEDQRKSRDQDKLLISSLYAMWTELHSMNVIKISVFHAYSEAIVCLLRSNHKNAWILLEDKVSRMKVDGVEWKDFEEMVHFLNAKTGLIQMDIVSHIDRLKQAPNTSDLRLRLSLKVCHQIHSLVTSGVIDTQKMPNFEKMYKRILKTKSIKHIMQSLSG